MQLLVGFLSLGGASDNPCAQNFRGASPASEIEIQAVQNFVLERSDDILLSINFHSYGLFMIYPWAYTEVPPPDVDEMVRQGKEL